MGAHHAITRRQVLGMVVATGGLAMAGQVGPVFAQALKRTPGEILGPFYPVLRSVDRATDLTTVKGKSGRAAPRIAI